MGEKHFLKGFPEHGGILDLGVKADHSELSDKGTLIEVRPWHVLEEGLRNCAHCVIQNHVQ